jgi:hypothetical protein
VKESILIGAGVVAAAAAMALLGCGVAAASPDVIGQKVGDARSAITAAGDTVVISTVVGDRTDQADCVVARQQDRNVPAPENTFLSSTTEVLLSLNCDPQAASAKIPGYSAASPEGKAAAAAASSSAAAASAAASPAPAS